MTLVLHLETYDPALGENVQRRIEVASRLSVGRGPENDLVLPDPQRHLSKTHCIITVDAGGSSITDTSTNGVFLDSNPERLPRNVATPLAEGSVVRFGGYQLSVAAIAPSFAGSAEPARRQSMPADDGLFGDPLAAVPVQHDSGHGIFPGPAPDVQDFDVPRGGSFAPVIPEDVDLFLDNAPAPQPWLGASQPDHIPSDQVFFSPPKVSSETIPDDWDLSEFDSSGGRSGKAERRAQPRPPPEAEAPRAPARMPGPAPSAPASRASAGDGAAVASFLAAVGLKDVALGDSDKQRVMQIAGEAFVAMARGLAEILAARASTKQEFRIERTAIGAARNNPLKFSDSPDEAVRMMLLGSSQGFLPAREAVDQALDDIKSHQIAVLAGMQMALATVIARFDPAKLQSQLDKGSLIEDLLPGARKARYWDLFQSLYKEITAELEDDFQKAFGEEFARAYRKQIDR